MLFENKKNKFGSFATPGGGGVAYLTLKLTNLAFKMTFNNLYSSLNGLLIQKYIKKRYYTSFAICVCSKSYFVIFDLESPI